MITLPSCYLTFLSHLDFNEYLFKLLVFIDLNQKVVDLLMDVA